MPFVAVETCCKCGKAIELKKVKTYRVGEDYRLICVECLQQREATRPQESERKKPEKKR